MSRMKNEFDFLAGVHLGKELYFNRFRLMIDFYTNSDVIEDHNIGVERLNYFLTEIVARSIFVSEEDTEAIIKYTNANIPVLTVPHPGPFDPMVLAVIVTKMNSILEDTMIISDAELMSTVGSYITYVWDSADEDDEIHDIVDEEDEVKWWAAPGPRFSSYLDGTDISEVEEDQLFLTKWSTLGLHWVEDRDEEELEIVFTPEQAPDTTDKKIIKFTDFTTPDKNDNR